MKPFAQEKTWMSVLKSLGIALGFIIAFSLPFEDLAWIETIVAWLVPFFVLRWAQGRTPLRFLGLGIGLGLAWMFRWMVSTLYWKGGLSMPLAWMGSLLFYTYETLGIVLILALALWVYKKRGRWSATLVLGLLIMAWEQHAFRIYSWNWAVAWGGFPLLARTAGLWGSSGLSALVWGSAFWASTQQGRNIFRAPMVVIGLLALSLGVVSLEETFTRSQKKSIDLVVIQPNFNAGEIIPTMESEGWRLTDLALQENNLPSPNRPTLVLWAESSVRGINERSLNAERSQEASRRNIAWLFGTESDAYNLVRGEVSGRPSFIQAKVNLMDFGERMPGPLPMSQWLDRAIGFQSQKPGILTPNSIFLIPQRAGSPLRIHPLICSEVLDQNRVAQGVYETQPDLLTNHTNDGWFEKTSATFLHAAQIRLRACEVGRPIIRTTLTGASGIFLPDGTSKLWSGPRSTMTKVITPLVWTTSTPLASRPWFPIILWACLFGAFLVAAARRR